MSENWYDRLAVFDLETTGVDIETARIVTAHVGVIGPDGESIEQRAWLADPGVEIPPGASAVHGITTERARAEGRPAAEVVGEIVLALAELFARGIPVTVFNAPYDFSLLNRESLRHGIAPIERAFPVVDPLVIDKALDRYRKGKRTLEAAALHYGVSLTDAHDAAADAIAAGRVAQAIGRRYADVLPTDAATLHEQQTVWCADQAASFQEYMRRVKDPSFTTSGAWPQR